MAVLQRTPQDVIKRRTLEKLWIARFKASPRFRTLIRDDGNDILLLPHIHTLATQPTTHNFLHILSHIPFALTLQNSSPIYPFTHNAHAHPSPSLRSHSYLHTHCTCTHSHHSIPHLPFASSTYFHTLTSLSITYLASNSAILCLSITDEAPRRNVSFICPLFFFLVSYSPFRLLSICLSRKKKICLHQ